MARTLRALRTLTVIAALLVAAALAGCGQSAHPLAAPAGSAVKPGMSLGRGRVDDPRIAHLACMRAAHLPAVDVGQSDMQVGPAQQGAHIHFTPSPGAAQALQLTGSVQSAEVIGAALLYPDAAPDAELEAIENCLAQGVQG
jgi:hypothetical protein